MTLEEVQKDVESQVQLVGCEVERLKQQLASEKKNVSETSMELQTLRKELEQSKNEAEHLKSMERSSEDRRYARSKSRLELEDAKNTITELKEELAYKSSVNRSLGLQLEKTIESNSELLLEIKDLDDLLQSKEREIEELKVELEESQSNQRLEDEKMAWMKKLEESERERHELKEIILTLEETRKNQVSHDITQEVRADIDLLKKELEKAETEFADVSKENMNLLSQLMDLRHQTEEKEAMVQLLEQKLAMAQDQSSLAVEALEKKARDLQTTVNDLREKLHLSEELSQSQLDSNKVFLEDLNSTVEELRTRNEQLEILLKSSEERNSLLIEELEAQQKEFLEHEKERSLLVSQRGQLKILREKIATLTENYEIALERGEDLELANKALREENHKALAGLNEQLKITEDKLQEANAECMALKEKIEDAETRATDANEQISLLLVAKEAAEAATSSLHAAHAELQQQFASVVVDKEKVDASLSSLQVAHTQLQEQVKDAVQSTEAIHRLQERDIEVIELTEALNTAQGELKKTCKKLSEVEATMLTLQENLQQMQEERRSQNAHIADLELELTQMKEDLDASSTSLLASEDRIQKLQLQNTDLTEMLQSAMSFKEDVVSRLEIAIMKEAELEKKLKETEQAVQYAKNEKAASDQTIVELQDRVCQLDDERNASAKGKEEGDKREVYKTSQHAQLKALKASINDMKLEKERAESSLQKLQIDNRGLAQELAKWKEKVKVGGEELAVWKEKVKTSTDTINKLKRSNTSLEEKNAQLQDSNTKGVKKGADLDQKSELMKLRKHAADLRRKLLEQEDEKEDMRKKLVSIQKEVQRKTELLILSEKRLKEKEKEQQTAPRPPTKYLPSPSRRMGMADSNTPNGAKAMIDLLERVKFLEGELNIKTVELEATKFVLKEKEAGICKKDNCVEDHADTHSKWLPNKLERSQSQITDSCEHGLLISVDSQEPFPDGMKMGNQQPKDLLLEHNEATKEENASEVNMAKNYPLQCVRMEEEEKEEQSAAEMKGTHLQEELREMRERYSQMSLQFAELQVEKEELLFTMKNLSKDGYK
eukprot:c22442_g1_i2 orf=1200-4397(+)